MDLRVGKRWSSWRPNDILVCHNCAKTDSLMLKPALYLIRWIRRMLRMGRRKRMWTNRAKKSHKRTLMARSMPELAAAS